MKLDTEEKEVPYGQDEQARASMLQVSVRCMHCRGWEINPVKGQKQAISFAIGASERFPSSQLTLLYFFPWTFHFAVGQRIEPNEVK